MNTGDDNKGNGNVGNRNAGNWNPGDRNAGDWNVGNRNAGNWNSASNTNGFFNTLKPKTVKVFDVDCSFDAWVKADLPDFLYFELSHWVGVDCMTESEKEIFGVAGGYLKVMGYKEAFKKSYNETTEEDRKKVFNIPNFNAKKFYEISGIDVMEISENEVKKNELIEQSKELIKQSELLLKKANEL